MARAKIRNLGQDGDASGFPKMTHRFSVDLEAGEQAANIAVIPSDLRGFRTPHNPPLFGGQGCPNRGLCPFGLFGHRADDSSPSPMAPPAASRGSSIPPSAARDTAKTARGSRPASGREADTGVLADRGMRDGDVCRTFVGTHWLNRW